MLAIVFSSLYCISGKYHVRALDVGSRHLPKCPHTYSRHDSGSLKST